MVEIVLVDPFRLLKDGFFGIFRIRDDSFNDARLQSFRVVGCTDDIIGGRDHMPSGQRWLNLLIDYVLTIASLLTFVTIHRRMRKEISHITKDLPRFPILSSGVIIIRSFTR